MDTQQEASKETPEAASEGSEAPQPSTTVEGDAAGPPSETTADSGASQGDDTAQNPETIDEYERMGDFGAALNKWEQGLKTLKEGDVVQGTVLKVLDKEVIVDIGYKSEGVIDIDEFRGVDRDISIKVGDRVDVLLEKTEDSDGYVVLSKEKAERLKIWDVVEKAYDTGEAVVGRVIDRIKGGLKVDIGLPAFLPGSLVDVRPVRKLESLRGQEFRMRVIKVNKRRGNIVLSRKAVLEEENAEKKKKTLEELEEGKILRGVVKNLTEYGAFVDLGGIDGLLHITDMSWGRLSHPSEKFRIGDEADVVVLKFDRDRERVSLGFKQLQDDPWEAVAAKYPPHARIRGKVVSLTDYGAFVEVEEGIEGLIHVSEMSWTKRVKHPSKILSVGDWVECVVLEVDRDARRLSLGLKQTEPNPWDLINTKYRVGDKITGTVRNITDFGAFVEVEEGIDGLVHISDLSWTRRVKHPEEVLTKGEQVEAVILKIDSENQRLSLGVKQLEPNVLEDFFQSHGTGDILTGKIVRLTEFGAFVELLKDVEGLIHVSEMSKERIEKPEDSFEVGQEVRVKIIKMDPVDKKIGLSINAALDAAESESVQTYRGSQPTDGTATLGDLKSAEVLRRPKTEQEEPAPEVQAEAAPAEEPAPEVQAEAEPAEEPAPEVQAEAEPAEEPAPEVQAEAEPQTTGDAGAAAEQPPDDTKSTKQAQPTEDAVKKPTGAKKKKKTAKKKTTKKKAAKAKKKTG